MNRIATYCFYMVAFVLTISLSSCATIIGGAKYNAEVIVDNHPKAEITYNGQYIGSGRAFTKIQRRDANKISFTVQEEGKEKQTFEFLQRDFRGWSFVGTLLGWTGIYESILLPWGIAVDGITGSWWKPDEDENGIVKVDYDNYRYFLRYKPEEKPSKPADNTQQSIEPGESIESKLEQINSLKERGLISDEEYNSMRQNIINNF